MRRGITFLLGILVIVFFWFVVPVVLVILNTLYSFPVVGNVYLKALGFVVFLFGFSTMICTVRPHFLTGRVTPVAVEKPKELIDKGLYRYSRNPMYIAILMAFFGGFLILGHILLLAYVLIAIPALYLFVVYKEEPELKKLFGKDYEDYMKKVPCWLPKVFR